MRYTGAGLGYQLASVIAGGPAPLIAAAILAATGSFFWIAIYIIGCAVVSLIALSLMHPRPPDADDEHSEDHTTVPVVAGETARLGDGPVAQA